MNSFVYGFTAELQKIAAEVDPLEDYLRGAKGEARQFRETSRYRRIRKADPWVHSFLDPGSRRMRGTLREAKKELKYRERAASNLKASDDASIRQKGFDEMRDIDRKRLQVQDAKSELTGGRGPFSPRKSKAKAPFKPILTPAGKQTMTRMKNKAVGATALAAGAYGGFKYLQHKNNQGYAPSPQGY